MKEKRLKDGTWQWILSHEERTRLSWIAEGRKGSKRTRTLHEADIGADMDTPLEEWLDELRLAAQTSPIGRSHGIRQGHDVRCAQRVDYGDVWYVDEIPVRRDLIKHALRAHRRWWHGDIREGALLSPKRKEAMRVQNRQAHIDTIKQRWQTLVKFAPHWSGHLLWTVLCTEFGAFPWTQYRKEIQREREELGRVRRGAKARALALEAEAGDAGGHATDAVVALPDEAGLAEPAPDGTDRGGAGAGRGDEGQGLTGSRESLTIHALL